MRAHVAEALGTFLLVAVGCGAAAYDAHHGGLGISGVALVFGGTVALLVATLGPVSGAHLNPAVTLAFLVHRSIPLRQALGYWAVQALGATAGAASVAAVFPDVRATMTRPLPTLALPSAFGLETGITFVLVLVILSVATAPGLRQTTRAAAIGAAVWFGAYVGGPWTGGSMNPARSLGPALVSADLHLLWLYFAAPAVGALAAFAAFVAYTRFIATMQDPHPLEPLS